MASFISALSLLILVLVNGYLTLPLVDEKTSNLRFPSLNDDLTTERTFNTRFISDDELIAVQNTKDKRSSDEHIGVEISTSADRLLEENVFQPLKTREVEADKRETDKREVDADKREVETDKREDKAVKREVEADKREVETDKRGHHEFLFTTVEPVTSVNEFKIRKVEVEDEPDKREMEVELTTSYMPSFTSTSSILAPELYTSTKQYIGLLKDEKVHEVEEEPPKEFITTEKETTKPKLAEIKKSKDHSEEELNAPTAVFDQEALKKVSNVPNDFMVLDENNDVVVTGVSNILPTSTMEYKKELIPLKQGKQSSYSEEKKSDH